MSNSVSTREVDRLWQLYDQQIAISTGIVNDTIDVVIYHVRIDIIYYVEYEI